MTDKLRSKVVVYVVGGTVQAVYTNDGSIKVMVYDEDNIERGDNPPDMYDFPIENLKTFNERIKNHGNEQNSP